MSLSVPPAVRFRGLDSDVCIFLPPGCWFTSDTTRLLVNFIQRWIIIVSILAIYVRLYFIIYKAHRGTVSGVEAEEETSAVLNMMPAGSSKRAVSTIKLRNDAKALKRVRLSVRSSVHSFQHSNAHRSRTA